MKRLATWVCLLTIGLAAAAVSHPGGRARIRLLAAKLQGGIPVVSWFEVLADLPPRSWRNSLPDPRPANLVSGRVTVAGFEPSSPCPVLWSTPLGPLWGRLEDESILEWLVHEQVALHVYDDENAHVRPGDTVMDVGAHLGTFVYVALDRGAHKVIAFEPEPVNFECLQKTFAGEIESGRVVLLDAAVSDHPGELHFARGSGKVGSAGGKIEEMGELRVRATTIDDTVASLSLASVDFIKMDIEGAERFALAGARKTLQSFTPRMAICVYHRADDADVIPPLVLEAQPEYNHTINRTQAYFFAK